VSVKDTIKELENVEKQLEQAKALEESAIAIQRDAARLRDEADKLNRESAQFKTDAEITLANFRSESARKDDEYKNREVTLIAMKADLDAREAEQVKANKQRLDDLNQKEVGLANRVTACKEKEIALDERLAKYESVAQAINAIK